MVEFTLPKNSRVVEGISHTPSIKSEMPKKLKIYRWDPEKNQNPRIDKLGVSKH